MRIGEVLNLAPADIEDRKLTLRSPKSGKEREIVSIPQKVADRLKKYITSKGIGSDRRISPISYTVARRVVNKAG
jgi:integrase